MDINKEKFVFKGDSGYGMKEWLMTPLHRNPTDQAEQQFNIKHKATRRLIECAYGILKERFPCINHMRLQPERAAVITMACAALHNIAKRDDFDWTSPPDDSPPSPIVPPSTQVALDARTQSKITELLTYFA